MSDWDVWAALVLPDNPSFFPADRPAIHPAIPSQPGPMVDPSAEPEAYAAPAQTTSGTAPVKVDRVRVFAYQASTSLPYCSISSAAYGTDR